MLPPGAINEGPPVTPRPSATVLLIRGSKPWELLLMRRPGGADFAPDAHVFPGGTIHADDSEAADPIAAAAVRELFEEVGILLARKGGRFARDRDSEHVRSLLADGKAFGHALKSLGLEPAHDRLTLLTRWVTPAMMSRRYDARFFLARLPAGQTVRAQEGEVVDWLWIAPRRALVDPKVNLVYATRAVLETVADIGDAATVFAKARRQREVPTFEPQMVQTADGWEVVR
jgi:8-oxo-dGTP pyrophosphatase MutT (NUDIX family)